MERIFGRNQGVSQPMWGESYLGCHTDQGPKLLLLHVQVPKRVII